jgi:hypothetical protein
MKNPTRKAVVAGSRDSLETVQRYLPQNYEAHIVHHLGDDPVILIHGRDNAGWTLDEYVIPRLASGLIFAKEIEVEPEVPVVVGTISHGTLRREDLLPAFINTLSILAPGLKSTKRLLTDAEWAVTVLKEIDQYGEREAWDIVDDVIDALDTGINDALPDGWYFGAIEGDGSDFGVWEVEDGSR